MTIGTSTAQKMIKHRDPMATAALETFQTQKFEKLKASIQSSDHVLSREEIQEAYGQTSVGKSPEQTFERNKEAISSQAQESGLTQDNVSGEAVNKFNEQKNRVSMQVQQEQDSIGQNRQKIQQKNERRQGEFLTKRAIKNLGGITKE